MRRLAFVVLLACSCLPAQGIGGNAGFGGKAGIGGGASAATPSVTQTCTGGVFATNPSFTCSLGASTASGDALVAYIVFSNNTATVATPTGCASSWTRVLNDTTDSQYIYTGTATSGGACNITMSGTSAGSLSGAGIGYDLANTLTTTDTSPVGNSPGFCTSCTGPSITPLVNGDMILSLSYSVSTTNSALSYTQDVNTLNVASNFSLLGGHLVQGAAGITNATWTSAGATYFSAIIALKP